MKRYLAGLFLLVIFTGLFLQAELVVIGGDFEEFDVQAGVLSTDDDKTVIEYRIPAFQRYQEIIKGEEFYGLVLEGEPFLTEKGAPQLPYINRSIIIPGDVRKEVEFIGGKYKEYKMDVVPSRGILYRDRHSPEVPYQFDRAVYADDSFFPGKLTELSEPFIIRDFRGQTVTVYPFQYNPVQGILRVYKTMTVRVESAGECTVNVLQNRRSAVSREFVPVYENLFVNYHHQRHTLTEESGRMIVICHDPFLEAIQPYVDWKNQKGISTELYPVSAIGSSENVIKDFIRQQYELHDGLTYVQFAGNEDHIPSFRVRNRAADAVYSLLDGDDVYPDIFVGRFSAQNASQIRTQVARSIYYERDLGLDSSWLTKAAGLASDEGHHPSDIYHMNQIREKLLSYNYVSVDQIYDPYARAFDLINVLEEGRGLTNYTGHGSDISWGTSNFKRSNIHDLQNDKRLPFIFSVACYNGDFVNQIDSFAEVWLRATHSQTGAPTGAVAFYGSSGRQSWRPPMYAQKEANRLVVNEIGGSIGAICYNAASRMVEQYGEIGEYEFKNWHIFGDVSLQFRTAQSQRIVHRRSKQVFMGETEYVVQTNVSGGLVSLSYENRIIASGYTGDEGDILFEDVKFPGYPSTVDLTITALNRRTYTGTIEVIPGDKPYVVVNEIKVTGEGEDGAVEYGNSAEVSVSLRNIGAKMAESVRTSIISNSNYVTPVDSTRFFCDIEPLKIVTLNDAHKLHIAEDIPDGHQASLKLIVISDNDHYLEEKFDFKVNAPQLEIVSYTFDRNQTASLRNLINPGETVSFVTGIRNKGSLPARNAKAYLTAGHPRISFEEEDYFNLGTINTGQTVHPFFRLTACEELSAGKNIPLGVAVTSGFYTSQKTVHLISGPIIEDFAAGDFSAFDWQFSGEDYWQIDDRYSYRGGYSANSGEISVLGLVGATSMSVTIDVPQEGSIKFHRRVSSHRNRGFLDFYINDTLKGRWSGVKEWEEVSYDVSAGINTFKWSYWSAVRETYPYNNAWIDNIIFPFAVEVDSSAVFGSDPKSLDFGKVTLNESKRLSFHIRNFGNEEMTGTIETYEGFEIEETGYSILTSVDRSPFNRPEAEHRDDWKGARNIYNYQIPEESNIQLSLAFTPTEERQYDGHIIITANDPHNPQTAISVSASGVKLYGDEETAVPLVTELKPNYPNPFNSSTTISFSLSSPEQVTLDVFNIRGQRVKSLVNERKDAGVHKVRWDGTDGSGRVVASGVYLFRMQAGEYHNIRKMLYLK